jgi:hypothetical protein
VGKLRAELKLDLDAVFAYPFSASHTSSFLASAVRFIADGACFFIYIGEDVWQGMDVIYGDAPGASPGRVANRSASVLGTASLMTDAKPFRFNS